MCPSNQKYLTSAASVRLSRKPLCPLVLHHSRHCWFDCWPLRGELMIVCFCFCVTRRPRQSCFSTVNTARSRGSTCSIPSASSRESRCWSAILYKRGGGGWFVVVVVVVCYANTIYVDIQYTFSNVLNFQKVMLQNSFRTHSSCLRRVWSAECQVLMTACNLFQSLCPETS